MLYNKFQSPTIPATRQKGCVRCGVVGVGWFKPLIVFSLDQAVQFLKKIHLGLPQ